MVGDVEVGEVDLVVRDRSTGELYAVEVKAGRLDVSGVRQAYVNAQLLSMKPMVVCRGFADDAAMKLAQELGVRVIQLSDLFVTEATELYTLVRSAVADVLAEYLKLLLLPLPPLTEKDLEVLRALAESETMVDAAKRLGFSLEKLGKVIGELRSRGLDLGSHSFTELRLKAQLILLRLRYLTHV